MQAVASNYKEETDRLRRLTLLLGAPVLVAAVSLWGDYSLFHVAACVVLLLCVIMPVIMVPELRNDAFSPYSFFAFRTFFLFAVPAVLVLLSPVEPEESTQFAQGCLLVSGAVLLYYWGYKSRIGVKLARAVPLCVFNGSSIRDQRFWPTLIFLYGLGWVGRLGAAAIGNTHLPVDLGANWKWATVFDYLSTFGLASYILITFLLLQKSKSRPGLWLAIVGLLLTEIAVGALNGGRSAIASPLLYFLLAYGIGYKRIRWRSILLAFIAAFVLLAPLLTIYRTAYYEALMITPDPGAETVLTAGKNALNDVLTGRADLSEALQGNMFSSGTGVMASTFRVLDRVPSVYPFQWGKNLFAALIEMPIPRVLWPDKPVHQPGREFAVRFFAFDPKQIYGTSILIGMPAEAYYNFGWVGLAIFPILGIGFRFFTERYLAYRLLEPLSIIRLVFILFHYQGFGDNFLYFIGGLLQTTLVFMLYLAILNWQLPVVWRWPEAYVPNSVVEVGA